MSRISTVVVTGRPWAPIAAMVETSPATPPAPLASPALKLRMQAGAWDSAGPSSVVASSGRGVSVAMGERMPGFLGGNTGIFRVRLPTRPYKSHKTRGYNPDDCSDLIAVDAVNESQTWMCLICGWMYDEAIGDPEHGIAPGTRWADVPMNWVCPECGARKEDFEMVAI